MCSAYWPVPVFKKIDAQARLRYYNIFVSTPCRARVRFLKRER